MADSHDRKSFFKQLLRGAVTTTQEVTQAFQDVQGFDTPTPPDDPYGMTIGETYGQRPVAAPPTTRTATEDDLSELAHGNDLGGRLIDLTDHARVALRLTRGDGSGRSRLGGGPDVPAGFEWPMWRDGELDFVAQVDLAEAALLGHPTGLPSEGMLLVFAALASRPSGLRPDDKG